MFTSTKHGGQLTKILLYMLPLLPNSTLTLTIQESATCLLYNGCGTACCWRGDDEDDEEDDIDDDDEADDVGEGLSQFSGDRSPCKDLLKEAGGVREDEDVSSEMS